MDRNTRHVGHAHDSWHLLQVTGGGFEESDGGGGTHIRRGGWRLSPGKLTHDIQTSQTGAACRNIHIHDGRLQARLTRTLDSQHYFLGDDKLDRRPLSGNALLDELALFALIAQAAQTCRNEGDVPAWLEEARLQLETGSRQVAQIAIEFGVSREHFCRTFGDHFGCSPVHVRRNHALSRAVDLLKTSDAPISEIALISGFYDQGHMTNAMTAKLGLSPGLVRRQLTTSQNSNTGLMVA